ncbi:kinase-like domain-containing protein [Gigaspora rosea]|uniref:Kinase-like domain-containing protein n=1 Tax=Gigaspora rosea TaxID=44941 RepID=A0A397VY70_9GLOM|nr:kinase-like domain-containing protein [Gigaspora rosea]
MADNKIQLLEIELQFCFAKNDTQFEEKLDSYLSTILKMLANPHEVERKKDKFTHLLPLIKNIELKPCKQKKLLSELVLELSQKLSHNFANLEKLETKEADSSILELIGEVLLFSLLKIIKETRIENFDNLMGEQEKCQTLMFKLLYGPLDLPTQNSEKVIIIKFQEFNQLNRLDQLGQWTNEESIQSIINILEDKTDKSSHTIHCCILKYASDLFPFAPILKKVKFSQFSRIVNLIYKKSSKCTHQLVDTLQISKLTSNCKYYQNQANIMNKIGYSYQNGIGVERDVHKAFNYYQKSANMGNVNGILKLGTLYRCGIGVKKDENKAFIHYQKAAEMGSALGTYFIGLCYKLGIGVEKDEHKAFIYYKKSADMGYADGITMVGQCYQNGIGVKEDKHTAFIYFQKAAVMGNSCGIHNIGHCYEYGIGVEKDEHKAFICYQNAAEVGDYFAMNHVSYCYRHEAGTARDLQKANFWNRIERQRLSGIHESSDIDNNLKEALLEIKYPLLWISYDEFKDIKKLGNGGFATVYRSEYYFQIENGYICRDVALKLIHGSKNCPAEFIKELKVHCEICDNNPSFLKSYGISKHNVSEDYIIVLEYTPMGSLRQNLYSVSLMEWKNKLSPLHCIASDLQALHSQNCIHRDLHSGNILQESINGARIADFGLLVSTSKSSNIGLNVVCGILPYIPPEVLNNQTYTTASDMYSLGIIMWEILFGIPITIIYDEIDNLQLQILFNGLRPPIFDLKSCYIDVMKICWENDPKKRPSAIEICETFVKWQNDENILLELTENDKKVRKLMIQITLIMTSLLVIVKFYLNQ